jgi:DNA-directed RNA polymerase specialized sigma24 family protein
VLRHRVVADRQFPALAPVLPSAEDSALAVVRRSSVLAALSRLPFRQREVMVLRYYADLSEAQIAAALGISRGAVKSHTARAKESLRAMLRLSRANPTAAESVIAAAASAEADGLSAAQDAAVGVSAGQEATGS